MPLFNILIFRRMNDTWPFVRAGMRRPSWNKSQAIQQVISLKALLEGRPGAGDPPVSSFLLPSKSPHAPTPSHVRNTTLLQFYYFLSKLTFFLDFKCFLLLGCSLFREK